MLPCWGRGLVPRPKSMETQKQSTEPKLRCINICSKTMIVMLIHITSFWNTLIWMILHYIPPNDINLLIWCNSAQTTAKQHLSTSFNIHNDIQYVVWLSVFLIVFFIIYKHFHGFDYLCLFVPVDWQHYLGSWPAFLLICIKDTNDPRVTLTRI